MFCDLVDFTGFCEAADSEDVDRLLREFYGLARSAIEIFGGVIEKYVGDAVVGVFGVPAATKTTPSAPCTPPCGCATASPTCRASPAGSSR